jgi:hypothetical protein
MATKVYSYGCKNPRVGSELIDQQISLAHKYYNKLIELQRKQMEDAENARREMFPEFAAIEQLVTDADAEVEKVVNEIRAANAKERRKRATKEESKRLTDAKTVRKEAWTKRKEIRAAISINESLQTKLAEIYANAKEEKTKARAECGVYWGTYGKVEAAVEASIKKSFGPPRFKRWDGSGQVAIQVQYMSGDSPIGWHEMFLGKGKIKGLVQVEQLPTKRTGKSARPWLVSIRVGSDENKKPIWAKVMAYIHRPLPEDAKIMGVSLVRRPLPPHRMSSGRYEPRYDWSLQFTIRTNEEKPRATSGKCAIDLGWRMIDGNLRVAYLVSESGHREELLLPQSLLNRWSKSESIQSIRDRAFDAVKAQLIKWKQSQESLPEWFTEAAKLIGQWKSKGRLNKLIDQWSGQRIDGDDETFSALTKWRDQDMHLWQYGAENLLKAQRIRLHLYRVFVRKIVNKYGTIVVGLSDWSKMLRNPKVDENRSDASFKEYARIASVGKLSELFKQSGAEMLEESGTTKRCHACGSMEEFDRRELTHTCSTCSLLWDQDYNAAMNMLTTDVSNEPTANAEVKYVGRFAKRKAEQLSKGDIRAEMD